MQEEEVQERELVVKDTDVQAHVFEQSFTVSSNILLTFDDLTQYKNGKENDDSHTYIIKDTNLVVDVKNSNLINIMAENNTTLLYTLDDGVIKIPNPDDIAKAKSMRIDTSSAEERFRKHQEDQALIKSVSKARNRET